MDKFKTAFLAYPAQPADLIGPIVAAGKSINDTRGNVAVTLWPQLPTFGAYIPDQVRNGIFESDVFICDVTKPNSNVYYEAGYAIGLGKPVAPIVNTSFANAVQDIQKDGFFDNVGFETYENTEHLVRLLQNLPSTGLVHLYAKPINFQQPLYFLDSFRKTDFRNAIASAIKASKVFYRSFDPVEISRFRTVSIIAETSASAGVIVQFLNELIDDAPRHNLRAAFLAGLCHGLGRDTLLLKFQSDAGTPADFRDDIISIRNPAEIGDLINEFARGAMLAGQSLGKVSKGKTTTALQRVSLGASAAENEFRTLEEYFVETAEYVKTLRGEVGIVAGRKGSGKTAIFFRSRDSFREANSLVTDLKPESHQLSLFRQELLKVVDVGAFDHTLAAFWYFVILSELLLTLKRKLEYQSKVDSSALEKLVDIEAQIKKLGIEETGDFTNRINRLGKEIADRLHHLKSKGTKPTPELLTNIVFASGVGQIKSVIQKYTTTEDHMVLLFDNIDKGWPANGVDTFDVRLVRLLIEALDKIRKDFNAAGRDFKSVVFLRNDIYELLLEATPDRGKAGEIRIDWTDRAKLRQVIYRRLLTSSPDKGETFDQAWTRIFIPQIQGKDSFEYFLDHCLMRPRFLINIVENALANGINRGHGRVMEEDCIDAVRQHSLYLMDDFGYEIRDVSGLSADILYSLIGVSNLLTREEIIMKLGESGIKESDQEYAVYLLLWYGLLGVAKESGKERFIYDYEYNMKRLEAEIRNANDEILYVTNPAIHVALSS